MTYYSTVNDIRDEAGFKGNSNIKNETILKYQKEAYSYIRSRIAAKYVITNLVIGNPSFDDSDARKFLKRVEELFAAWRLLIKEYGPDGTEQKEQGEIRLEDGEQKIQSLFESPFAARLVDINWVEFERVPFASSWSPVSSGMIGVQNKFTIDQKF